MRRKESAAMSWSRYVTAGAEVRFVGLTARFERLKELASPPARLVG